MSSFWNKTKVLVTGGSGFIGSHVVEDLVSRGAKVTVLDHIQNGKIKNIGYLRKTARFISGDCGDSKDATAACKGQDIVMNLAARVGGIEFNRTHQGTTLYSNVRIASTMLEAARLSGVKRFLVVSSACVYPHDATIPTPESEGMRSEPEPTNGGYGWAKRMAEILGMYYASEFGMKICIVRPYNAYGPRDNFNPSTSHVIPALIKRVFDGENPIIVWGTGRQTRAFLYVTDLARGMIEAVEKYSVADPLNLGTNEEVSLKTLVTKIVKISGTKSRVVFDRTKPDGSPRRNSDNRKAHIAIGFNPTVSLDEGLQKTIRWYKKYSL